MSARARDGWMTPAEVAAILQVPRRTVLLMCQRGDLGAIKAGRQWRIPTEALDDLKERALERRGSSPKKPERKTRADILKLLG